MKDSSSTSFSFPKRDFLHSKLDEIIRLWHRGVGRGSFFLSISDGTPTFEHGLRLGLEDGPASEPSHHQQPHHLPPNHRRRRGPAQIAKNRKRAALYQAAKAATAAASAVQAPTFPGKGKVVGTASGPTLPIPLAKGAKLHCTDARLK